MNRGILAALAAYLMWGVMPIYWKAVQGVPALEVVAHRTLWSFLFLFVLLAWQRRWDWLREMRKGRRTLLTFATTAGLLGANWAVFLWAVQAGYIVDVSLGYFVNPLINVLFGVLFLGERVRPWQGVAIAIAMGGVVYLTLNYGAFPWVALTLASTFALYGLLRKTAVLDAMEGLFAEMALLAAPAVAILVYRQAAGPASLASVQMSVVGLLVLSGVVTALPLMWFTFGARRVMLTTMGFLQYIAPTLQFLLGVVIYGEGFTQARMIGFSLIWASLAVYSFEGMVSHRKNALVKSHA